MRSRETDIARSKGTGRTRGVGSGNLPLHLHCLGDGEHDLSGLCHVASEREVMSQEAV
jgi:hypothetical protein